MYEVLDYLRNLVPRFKSARSWPGVPFSGPEEYVLVHGQRFASSALTSKERDVINQAFNNAFEEPDDAMAGRCYVNAQGLVLGDQTRQLIYCEGYAASGCPVVFAHGWAVLNGKVIDITWDHDGQHVLGKLPPGWDYVGIEIERDYLVARRSDMERHWSLLVDDHWEYRRFFDREGPSPGSRSRLANPRHHRGPPPGDPGVRNARPGQFSPGKLRLEGEQ